MVERWHRDPDDPRVPARVAKSLRLAEQWEEGYVQKCLAPGGDKRRVLTSEASKRAKGLRAGRIGALPSLLEQARDATAAAAALQKSLDFPRRRCTARRMYRLLGDALARVMASTAGGYFDSQVQELSSLLLGAEHYLDEKKYQMGKQGRSL